MYRHVQVEIVKYPRAFGLMAVQFVLRAGCGTTITVPTNQTCRYLAFFQGQVAWD